MKDYVGATIDISSFRGMCGHAIHYYGKVILFPDYDEIELTRPIIDSELKTDRFKGYCKGDNTNAYNTWKDVILAGKEITDNLKIKEVSVCGIPNNDKVTLEYALSNKVDTSLRCTRCGKIITGGCYNYPSGCLCIKCAENENK